MPHAPAPAHRSPTSPPGGARPGADAHTSSAVDQRRAASAKLAHLEQQIARLRAEQIEVLAELRCVNLGPAADVGHPKTSTPEGTESFRAAALFEDAADTSSETAEAVAAMSRILPSHPMVHAALAHGDITFERAVELTRLLQLGHSHSVDIGWMRSVAELRHLADLAEHLIASRAVGGGPAATVTTTATLEPDSPATSSSGA